MKFGKWVRIPHGLALEMSRKGRIAARQPFGPIADRQLLESESVKTDLLNTFKPHPCGANLPR